MNIAELQVLAPDSYETVEEQHRDEVLEFIKLATRPYANSAVAICKVRNRHVEEDGKIFNVELLSTAVFVRSANSWRIATNISVVDPKLQRSEVGLAALNAQVE